MFAPYSSFSDFRVGSLTHFYETRHLCLSLDKPIHPLKCCVPISAHPSTERLRILFYSFAEITTRLGTSKVVIELAEALRQIGCICDVVGPNEIAALLGDKAQKCPKQNLLHYLCEHAREYDIIDYDHEHLPFSRSHFPNSTLFVARSALLVHHFSRIRIPRALGIRGICGHIFRRPFEVMAWKTRLNNARVTLREADLINVACNEDEAELVRDRFDIKKIIVLPFGITDARRALFDRVSSAVPDEPMVGFVGTFDYRKGAREFPAIADHIGEALPNVRFRLLGTRGMFPTKESVISQFSQRTRPRIEVFPRFDPNELPSLLTLCSVGIFPSYVEGCPFGILEMMAASLPVVAYRSPGPTMLVSENLLVARGAWKDCAEKIIDLLKTPTLLTAARKEAKTRSQSFQWHLIASQTLKLYKERLQAIRCRPGLGC